MHYKITIKNTKHYIVHLEEISLCTSSMFIVSRADRLTPFAEEEVPTYQPESNREVSKNFVH
jgi:hypothetical protein